MGWHLPRWVKPQTGNPSLEVLLEGNKSLWLVGGPLDGEKFWRSLDSAHEEHTCIGQPQRQGSKRSALVAAAFSMTTSPGAPACASKHSGSIPSMPRWGTYYGVPILREKIWLRALSTKGSAWLRSRQHTGPLYGYGPPLPRYSPPLGQKVLIQGEGKSPYLKGTALAQVQPSGLLLQQSGLRSFPERAVMTSEQRGSPALRPVPTQAEGSGVIYPYWKGRSCNLGHSPSKITIWTRWRNKELR